MTIKQAAMWLCQPGIVSMIHDPTTKEALSVAVKALAKSEHGTNLAEVGTDCISRQTAMDGINEYMIGKRCDTDGTMMARLINELVINKLPPIQPQRMRAKWIATTALQEGQITWRDYKCSNCSHHRGKPMNFCEVCGAKMER